MSVNVAGKMSSLKQVTKGVPQGSMLDSILFLVYVSTIAKSLQCQWKPFVVDFKLYLSFLRSTCVLILQGMMLLQNDLERVCLIAKS